LLDGYFWSKENMLSATYFLEKYREFIEFSWIIPSYAGELLIKTKPTARHILVDRKERRYSLLKNFYNRDYYLKNCGGYEQFKRNKGIILDDPRLLTAYYIADPHVGKKILDIGCGRGELSYALARAGADVMGIDYSASAVKIAKETFHNDTGYEKVQFVNDDFLKINFKIN
jgi:2-polyprenyl-3-methyl-5-hydroxy-6-metoxy-1,4-benzoquinol methylase